MSVDIMTSAKNVYRHKNTPNFFLIKAHNLLQFIKLGLKNKLQNRFKNGLLKSAK